MVLKESLMLTKADKNTVKTVKLWNIITIWNDYFLWIYILKCNGKAEFSASLLLSLVSRDP